MKRYFAIIVFAAAMCSSAWGQSDRSEVRAGNRKFSREKFDEAEIDYRKAVVKDSLSLAGGYNLASALYREEDYESAAGAMEVFSRHPECVEASPRAADIHYNAGDIALQRKDYASAVECFKQSLLRNPGDIDAKENYIYAKMMLQNQDQDQDQDQNQDQNQNQNQNQNQDQDQNQEQDQNQKQDQDQQPSISPQQAQQMLKAIQAQEKETQDKVNKEKAAALQSRQKEKNW